MYNGMTKAELEDLVRERQIPVEGSGQGGMILKSDLIRALEQADEREAAEEEEFPPVCFEDSEIIMSEFLPEEEGSSSQAAPPPSGYLYVRLADDAPHVVSVASKIYPSGRRIFERGKGPYLVSQLEYDGVLRRGGTARFFVTI